MSEVSETTAGLGSTPIAGDSPAGQAIRYEPEFERLQAEIDKMSSVTGGPVNWNEVTRVSRSILERQSKDLLVAAYLAVALLRTRGLDGLAAGVGVVRDLVQTFWESLFPPLPKLRGREAAIGWLDEHGAKALVDVSVSQADRERLQACSHVVEELSSALRERMPESDQSVDGLARELREKSAALPAEAAPAAAGDAAAPGASAVLVREAIDSENKARDAILEAVAFLRSKDPTDPRPYQSLRALLFSEVVRVPPHEGGRTAVPGGDAESLAGWEAALKAREHQRVLGEVEARLPDERLWVDLSYLAARALGELGEDYAAARAAVCGEVGILVRRLPELCDLAFESGVPFASEAARLWVHDEILAAAPGTGGEAGGPATAAGDKLTETVQEARKLARGGKLSPATSLLQKEIQALPQGRDRFLWRLELAKLCADAGQAGLALPLFESLDEEARRFGIEEWEPSLCVEVVKQLWQCYSAARGREGFSEKADQVYARLCRLDLMAAMALDRRD